MFREEYKGGSHLVKEWLHQRLICGSKNHQGGYKAQLEISFFHKNLTPTSEREHEILEVQENSHISQGQS
uniref:Uncharacterized protein n=1 Tax=Lepeophtheirus salmonis TaxID=72036 RepID=A0A0K2UEJ3_LEPSM